MSSYFLYKGRQTRRYSESKQPRLSPFWYVHRLIHVYTFNLLKKRCLNTLAPFQTYFKTFVICSKNICISAFQLCLTSIKAEVESHSWSHFDCMLILYIPNRMGSHQLLFTYFKKFVSFLFVSVFLHWNYV